MKKDHEIEIAFTLAAIAAALALAMWHRGAASATAPLSVPAPEQNPQDYNWNPAQNIAPVYPSDTIAVYGTNVPPAVYNISGPPLLDYKPVNISGGSPSCGCAASNTATIDGLISQQNSLLAQTFAALEGMPHLVPVVPVTINIEEIPQGVPLGVPRDAPNIQSIGNGEVIYGGPYNGSFVGAI